MLVLNYWQISEYLIHFGVTTEDEYQIYINHELKFSNAKREDCYAYALDFIESLQLD